MLDSHKNPYMKTPLISRFRNKQALIGVAGLGYVGLPLVLRFNAVGFRVLGIDIDPVKVARLNAGESYIEHIPANKITAARGKGFEATTDFTGAAKCDALILCVPTPLGQHREPDMTFVINTVDALLPSLRAGQVVSLESTTYPGTTEEELLSRIERQGFKVGEDIFLVYSPEREDPGNPDYQTSSIPKVIGGHTSACLEVGLALYGQAIDRLVPVSSTKTAEMTKLLENIHRAVNIGLINEMKIVADSMGVDIYEVIDAAATKPFGFTPFYPGPGLGGHCIPIDPFYLTWKAREYGINTRFIELAGEVNSGMPAWVIGKLADALNDRHKSIRGSRILILGIAYKKNVDDTRESPAAAIMELLRDKGAELAYSDPHVPAFPPMREHRFDLKSEDLTPDTLKRFDAVVLVTQHDNFDYSMIKQHASLIIDSRGVYREPASHIVRA